MAESKILKQVWTALCSTWGARLFRNQVGEYKLADGRYLASGLCTGSSDLVGWQPILITPEMVGKRLAVFLAVEIKTPEARRAETQIRQENFISILNEAGGIGFIARSPEEAKKLLEKALCNLSISKD